MVVIIYELFNGCYHHPLGYENRNKYPRADSHEYIINAEGLLIRQAFKWKVAGKYSNFEIVERLRAKGSNITVKNFVWIMANPFYRGYIRSSLLSGELIKGKHPP